MSELIGEDTFIEDLTDDFLVESIDAENAEELISKVVSKYS